MAHNDAAIAVHATKTAVKKLADAIVSIGRRPPECPTRP
jgi:hypothetical protein